MREQQSGDELIAAFRHWAAAERVDVAATVRARERSLRAQASASATWAGVLLDLAERQVVVSTTVAGRRRRGRLVGVGRDFCVLESPVRLPSLISLGAISVLWPDPDRPGDRPAGDSRPGPPLSSGARRPPLDLSLASALSALAEDRGPVALFTRFGEETTGNLISAGEDVLTLQAGLPSHPGRTVVYVPLSALALCDLR